MKKILAAISLLIVIVVLFAACSAVKVGYGEQLVKNGNFENGNFSGWTLKSQKSEGTAPSIMNVQSGSDYDKAGVGTHYVSITASSYNSYVQTVSVQKNSIYRLSALVCVTKSVTSAEALGGAFIGLDENYTIYQSVTTTASKWQALEVYFNSKNYESVAVRFGVGTASKTANGSALFDNVSLEKVKSAPAGVMVYDFNGKGATASAGASYNDGYRTNSEGKLYVALTAVLGAMLLYAGYVALRRLSASKGAMLTPITATEKVSFWKSATFMLIIAEVIGFIVRLLLVNFVSGKGASDLAFEATKLHDIGASKYYFNNKVTTPIGSLYLLWLLGTIAEPLNFVAGGTGYAIFVRIPAIIADLITVFMVYYIANRKFNQYISAVFAGVYAAVPVLFFASAGWGVYASIGALFLLAALLKLLDKNYIGVAVYYSLALLFSTEVLLVLPLLLIYLGYVFVKDDDAKMTISLSFTVSVIALYLIALPFTYSYFAAGRPFVVVSRYCQAFLTTKGFTENAFTVYGLLGLGAAEANTASVVFSVLFVVAAMVFTIVCYFKSKSRLDVMLLSAFTFAVTFVLTSAVNMWMLYIALPLLCVYGIMTGDRRILKVFGCFAITMTVNTAYAMAIGGYFGTAFNSAEVFMSASDPVLIIFSIFNVAILAYFAVAVYQICFNDGCKGIVIIKQNYFAYVKDTVLDLCNKAKNLVAKLKKGKTDAGESK